MYVYIYIYIYIISIHTRIKKVAIFVQVYIRLRLFILYVPLATNCGNESGHLCWSYFHCQHGARLAWVSCTSNVWFYKLRYGIVVSDAKQVYLEHGHRLYRRVLRSLGHVSSLLAQPCFEACSSSDRREATIHAKRTA